MHYVWLFEIPGAEAEGYNSITGAESAAAFRQKRRKSTETVRNWEERWVSETDTGSERSFSLGVQTGSTPVITCFGRIVSRRVNIWEVNRRKGSSSHSGERWRRLTRRLPPLHSEFLVFTVTRFSTSPRFHFSVAPTTKEHWIWTQKVQ